MKGDINRFETCFVNHFVFTEIVLPLGFADAIFRRERSDDRKCVCCSQATVVTAIFKTRNGQSGNRNGERGIFKMGNL